MTSINDSVINDFMTGKPGNIKQIDNLLSLN